MSRRPPSAASPGTLDLFADLPTAPRRAARTVPISVRPLSASAQQSALDTAALAALPDVDLVALVTKSVRELRRRMSAATGPTVDRAELKRAARAAARTLADPIGHPRPGASDEVRTSAGPAAGLHDTKRSAVRAALKAGVKPGQVARHFGLPLAAVRKIAADAE